MKSLSVCNWRWVRAIELKHLHPPSAFRRAKLDAVQIRRHVDRARVIGDIAEPVLKIAEDAIAFCIGRVLERATQRLLNPAHVVAVLNNVRHLKDTCLLYTSPSPRDLSTSRMPSSA